MSVTSEEHMFAFRRHFSALSVLVGLGFGCKTIERVPPTKVVGESYHMYLANSKDRSVEITYYPPFHNENDAGMLIVFVEKLGNKNPIDVEDWLKKHDRLESPKAFVLSSYEGSYIEKLEGCSKFLNEVFTDPELQAILKGETWEHIPYYPPWRDQ
jgi:hypothetical protein